MRKILVLLPFILMGCSQNKKSADIIKPKTDVTITHVTQGTINDSITFTATTAYLNKSSIASPIPAFITKVYIQQGSRVRAGQTILRLESKERKALGLDNNATGIVYVKASTSGIVIHVNQQEGDYVTEGTLLCTIANQNSLVFQINVPYEYTKYVIGGKKCILTLPDGSVLKTTIGRPLATMNTISQSQQYIAKAKARFLPEGLIAKASVLKGTMSKSSQILPKGAVQCDESMQHYWIMRLVNDSVAVKQDVKIGNSNAEKIEILSPILSPSDRIILNGSYAMEDSTLVKIVNK
jgi:multidrug efflux pump subunit AcrA (membrane-fusion protein)